MRGERVERAHLRIAAAHPRDAAGDVAQLVRVGDRPVAQVDLRDPRRRRRWRRPARAARAGVPSALPRQASTAACATLPARSAGVAVDASSRRQRRGRG